MRMRHFRSQKSLFIAIRICIGEDTYDIQIEHPHMKMKSGVCMVRG